MNYQLLKFALFSFQEKDQLVRCDSREAEWLAQLEGEMRANKSRT